jgi:hypothetical protein
MTGNARVAPPPLGGEVGGVTACSLVRVGACADELRLMGEERAEVFNLVGRMGGGVGSLSRKASRSGCGAVHEGTVRIARRMSL